MAQVVYPKLMKPHRSVFSKWLLTVCLIAFTAHVYAQQRYYCEVKGIEKNVSAGLKIICDFGTESPYSRSDLNKELIFVDEKGEEIKFNSMVDAANYMVQRGWTFQQAYSSMYGGKPIIHWIFFKDAENMEKAKEGILTKIEYQKKQDRKQLNNRKT